MRKLYLFLFIMGSYALSIGQATYHLSFENAVYSVSRDSLRMDIMLSLDEEGKLGSSNLVFTYDTAALRLLSFVPDSTNPHYALHLSSSQSGKTSYNMALLDQGQGDSIPALPGKQKLTTLIWEVRDGAGNMGVTWYEEDTRGTVIFLEDEATQLLAGTLEGYTPFEQPITVEELSFTVTQWGERARLNWSTEEEVDNLGFIVGRSLDAVTFEQVGYVPSQGNSTSPQHYEWIDYRALTLGLNTRIYYRITQVNRLGTLIRSQVKSLVFDPTGLEFVQVYPTELSEGEALTVELILPGDTQATLRLHNTLGQLVSEKVVEVSAQTLHITDFEMPLISPGIYTLSVIGVDEVIDYTRIKLQ